MLDHPVAQSIFTFLHTGLLDWSWWKILLFTLVTTHLTIIGVTVYLHRCQAHRALDLHPIASHFFRFWLWLTTGMVTKEWAAIHRKHHARCEQEGDPHSPKIFGIRKVFWEGVELYREAAKDKDIMKKFGHGTPDDWIERKLYTPHSSIGIYFVLVIDLLLFGVIGLSVFAVQMLWIPILAAGVINGLGHWWGYRNYDCPDMSTNLVPWGILIGGEELHNNHHAFGSSAKLSSKWYEFDAGWMYIRIMQFLGLAKVRKVQLAPKFQSPTPNIDLQTLQTVIAHRYDLMQAYGRGLRSTWLEEIAKLKASGRDHLTLARDGRAAVREVRQHQGRLSENQRAEVSRAFAGSESLSKLIEMRDELVATWERSTLSTEQLLAHLQEWCVRAEQSGVRALQDIALRMRRYVPVASGPAAQ